MSLHSRIALCAPAGLLVCVGFAGLALPGQAHAQLAGSASATAQYESNSNLFAQQFGTTQPASGNHQGSTTDFSYGALFSGTYSVGKQQFYASANAHKFDYEQFSDLDHTEYGFNAGLRWQLTEILNGDVEVSRTRSMVPFLDLTGSSVLPLSLFTAQKESFQLGLKLGPEWKLDGSAYTTEGAQPEPGAPDQQLTETGGTVDLEYAGLGPFNSGVTASYTSGGYAGLVNASDSNYSQVTAGLVADYKLERTSFTGQVTYSRRTSDAGPDRVSGLTGSISFTDQLTAKTSFSLTVGRAINTQYLNLGTEFDTDASVSVNWKATHKISVTLGYSFTYRAFPGQEFGPDAYPVDYQQYANLGISYQLLRWLQIAPYANLQTRRANVAGRDFNATVYGVTLTATPFETGHGK